MRIGYSIDVEIAMMSLAHIHIILFLACDKIKYSGPIVGRGRGLWTRAVGLCGPARWYRWNGICRGLSLSAKSALTFDDLTTIVGTKQQP